VNRRERPVPPPLEGNDRLITAVITAGWAIALIILLALRGEMAPSDRWWIWVAAFGTFLGLFGLAYVPYLKRSRERAGERRRAGARQAAADELEPERIDSERGRGSRASHRNGTPDG
jgi:Protein of unknown function (DUF2530)